MLLFCHFIVCIVWQEGRPGRHSKSARLPVTSQSAVYLPAGNADQYYTAGGRPGSATAGTQSCNKRFYFITRECSYCFQRVLATAILSVCPSVCHTGESVKTVQDRITKSSPSAAWKTLVLGTVKLFHKFEGFTPNEGAKWEGGGQNLRFLANKYMYLSNGAR